MENRFHQLFRNSAFFYRKGRRCASEDFFPALTQRVRVDSCGTKNSMQALVGLY